MELTHASKNTEKSNREATSSCKRLMLFDLSIYGHHPSYIQYLLEYWENHQVAEKLSILVSPKFLVEHFDVVDYAKRNVKHSIQFIAITPDEEATLVTRDNGLKRNWRNFQEWFLLCKYAKALQVDHVLLMYLDTYQLPLALGFNPPCAISGIYFRPTFHYPKLSGKHPSRREQLQQTWERILLRRVLHNHQFRHLLSLDPFVLKYIDDVPEWASVLHLPDPVRFDSPPANLDNQLNHLRQKLGIEPNRQVFLLFGALTARKGIYQVLDSISLLPEELTQKLCLLLVGEADEKNQNLIDQHISKLYERYPIQIIRHYSFVPDSEIPFYFQLSDVILATYQRHVGMSGILIWAASTGKPVISSDYGLMGELVRQYQLGITLNSTDPEQITKGVQLFLNEEYDPMCMNVAKSFARKNSHGNFSKLIFQCLSK